jgi:hypothetical protein
VCIEEFPRYQVSKSTPSLQSYTISAPHSSAILSRIILFGVYIFEVVQISASHWPAAERRDVATLAEVSAATKRRKVSSSNPPITPLSGKAPITSARTGKVPPLFCFFLVYLFLDFFFRLMYSCIVFRLVYSCIVHRLSFLYLSYLSFF